jgi:hypothetical protein
MEAVLGWSAAAGAIFGTQFILQRSVFAGCTLLERRWRGYTVEDAHQLLSGLGQSRRMQYAWFQGLDFGLIISLTLAMLSLQQVGSRVVGDGPLRFAAILPLAYAANDAAEDVALLVLIATFPRRLVALSRLASRITSIKFVLVITSITVSLLLAILGSRRS